VRVIVNQAATFDEAAEVYERLAAAALQFLRFEVGVAWLVPRDPKIPEAVRRQRPLLALYPHSEASRAFRTLASAFNGGPAAMNGDGFFGKARPCVPFLETWRTLPYYRPKPVGVGGRIQ